MKKSVSFKFAASTLVLGLTMVGCKPSGYRPSVNSAKAATADAGAAKAYAKAQEAVQQGSVAQALGFAERAVEYAPRDSGYRMLLADLYLKNGRFVSAEQAFTDVLSLDPGNRRAGLSRVLAMIGQGKSGEASMELDRLASSATPADVGLAYALAGQPQRAVEMLEPAARAPGATGRVRQNLALAYALAGDWQKARRIAEQDLSPSEAAGRLEQWASFANPAAPYSQVATLLGVTPTADAGQPVRLALASNEPVAYAAAEAPAPAAAPAAPEPVRVAASQPAPVFAPVTSKPLIVAAAEPAPGAAPAPAPAPVPVAVAFAAPVPAPVAVAQAAPIPAPAPVALAEVAPISQPAPVAVAEAAPQPVPQAAPEPVRETFAYRAPQPVETFASAPSAPVISISVPSVSKKRPKRMMVEEVAAALDTIVKTPTVKRASVRIASAPIPSFKPRKAAAKVQPAISGRDVVQLGAFRTAAQVERAWAEAQRRYRLAGAEPLSTTVTIPGKGTFHRLSVAGFGNSADANRLCQSVRSRNGACFVRETAGDARVQWASRYSGRRA